MTKLLLPLLGLLAFVDASPATAADIPPAIGRREAFIDVQRGVRPRIRVYSRGYRSVYFGRRTIGMPCVLTPPMIAQANWNGPQCRWVDNITPSARIRYRVVYR